MRRASVTIGLVMASTMAWARPEWAEDLPEWSHRRWGPCELWQWVGVLVLLILATLFGLLVRFVLAHLTGIHRGMKSGRVKLSSGRGIKRALAVIAGTLFLQAGLPGLELPHETDYAFRRGLLVAAIAAATWVVAALWEVAIDVYESHIEAGNKRTANLVIPFVRRLGRFLAILTAGVAIVSAFGYNVTTLVAGLGIGGVALALAAKDSVENVFGSITILVDMPFAVGDWVKIDKVDGVVEEINLRSTRIRTFDDSIVTLPNRNLISASVENMGMRRYRRYRTVLLVPTTTPSDDVAAFCQDVGAILQSDANVWEERQSVTIFDIVDNGIRVQVSCYFIAETYDRELTLRQETILHILAAAEKRGIVIGGSPVHAGLPPGA
ncbi:MAG TPA: mechanosensitive ion channel [Fimbriimonadaceae bacterium]|nr:mechanosensitive ion channel [Fimbriimonadaceae bacterium]